MSLCALFLTRVGELLRIQAASDEDCTFELLTSVAPEIHQHSLLAITSSSRLATIDTANSVFEIDDRYTRVRAVEMSQVRVH